jgi:hypothetical protein
MNAANIFSTVSPTITPTSNNLAMKGSLAQACTQPSVHQPGRFHDGDLALPVGLGGDRRRPSSSPQRGSTTSLPTSSGFTYPLAHPAGRV